MKTYCKNIDITNVDYIVAAILSYISDKCKKDSTIRFYSYFSGRKRSEIASEMNPRSEFFLKTTREIAEEMSYHIANRTVREHIIARKNKEPVIRYMTITDVGSGKRRELGLETVLFRFYEVLANTAADPMFTAKIGEYQVASVKGKGQRYGKKAVTKWLSQDPEGTKFCCKADVKKCYPSIPHNELLAMFRRDLRKSHSLLYLFETIIYLYEEFPNPNTEDATIGILIGSPVSKDMCNYYMSKLYHYAAEKLFKVKTRRGKEQRNRLISHHIFYMDDIVIYGGNKRDLQKAMEMLIQFAKEEMKLTIKPDWQKFRVMYKTPEGKSRGVLLDFMGFQFHCGEVRTKEYYGRKVKYRKVWTTIRDYTFLKSRRKFQRFIRMVKRKIRVSPKYASSIASYYGCYTQTDSKRIRQKNNIDKIMRIARKIVSNYAKKKTYKTETYYKMWRCLLA